MVLENWWYKLADTNAKSILDADVLLSQENCVAFGCWVLQGWMHVGGGEFFIFG